MSSPSLGWLLCTLLYAVTAVPQSGLVNRAPQFLPNGDMSRFAISEDTPVGSAVYKLLGSDPEGSRVIYSISGEYFTVDSRTGVVTTLKPFDREQVDLVTVVISVTDEGLGGAEPNTVSLLREIPILDINDNSPTFKDRPYSIRLFENTVTGKKVFDNITVTDADGGINGDVILSCVPASDPVCSIFDITTEKVTEGSYKGIVTLLQPLDYELRSTYSLTVKATDRAKDPNRRLTATAVVVIDVLDVQDQPPLFLNAPYSATVAENTEEGTSILRVSARDGDMGDPRTVRIELVDDQLGYFQLQPESDLNGEIGHYTVVTTDQLLDREDPFVLKNGGIYSFTLRAVELINGELPADTSETTVTIVITDVDDQLPTFNYKMFHINVSEDIALDSPLPGLNMIITDKDIGENANYFLSLREISNSEGSFAVSPAAGNGHTAIVVRVKDLSNLDFDVEDPGRRVLAFDVVASIKNEYGVARDVSSSRVFAHLIDANDNAPVFANQTYHITIPENIAINQMVLNISATDKDSGLFAALRYQLKGFGSQKFKTHPIRGGIYTSSPLDYESQKSFTLNLVALDGGNKTTTATVYVDIEDVNDNKPTFELKEYSKIVRENATAFEPQFFVHAVDLDGPTQGDGRITYEIVSTNYERDVFRIDQTTGELIMMQPVFSGDTPKGQYELMVRGTDFGSPQQSEDVRVNIRVGVIGNQRPYFKGNSKTANGVAVYRLEIPENTKPGTEIHKIIAVDPDGANANLNYQITNGGKDNFVLNASTGVLSTSPYADLDLDSGSDSYTLQVIAVDAGLPIPETGSTQLTVTITDINNKPPVFKAPAYTQYISENSEINSTVLTVSATDSDQDSKLSFTLRKPIKVYDKSGLLIQNNDGVFAIDPDTGAIKLLQKLNHDLVNSVVLDVEARDLNGKEGIQQAQAEVTLYVQTSLDKNPVFLNSNWTAKHAIIKIRVNEELEKNTVVYTVRARDPVKNKTRIKYEVFENEYFDLFNVSSAGNVIVLRRLDYEETARKLFNLSVRAVVLEDLFYDINKKSSKETVLDLQNLPKIRYTDSILTIELVNINDNAPVFEEETYKQTVLESTTHPSVVLRVHATDLDNDSVSYSIAGLHASFFTINSTSGEVTVSRNVVLDRETHPMYMFNVTASDKNPSVGTTVHKTTAEVVLEVLDVNDNAPQFGRSYYSTVIPENVDVGTSILAITAIDPDLGVFGQVRYKIIEESEAQGFFKIDDDSGVISTNRILTGKGRSEPYNLIVKASDKGDLALDSEGKQNHKSLSSEVTLSIYVGDVVKNDGVPVFIKPTVNQKAVVSENASVNTPVFQVIVNDPDGATNVEGQIRYSFLDDGEFGAENPFKINPESGLISTKLLLDRESKDLYDLIIVAQDRGEVPQQVTRVLRVEVSDVDDHSPTFKRSISDPPIEMQIVEESVPGVEVGLVQAVDEDSGENAEIDYIISDGNEEGLFNITRTEENIGVIRIAGRIDREMADSHLLTVKCFKKAADGKKLDYIRPYNRQDPSERQIRVKVRDIDDNSPRFPQTNLTIGIRLIVPPDTALTTLYAEDVDADSAPLEYYILNITFYRTVKRHQEVIHLSDEEKLFSLDSKSGELKTLNSVIKYNNGYFDIRAYANNTNLVHKRANITIRVRILRDKSLLKLVFNSPPTDVRKQTGELEKALSAALPGPFTVSIYDAQFRAKSDGSLDFSSTSACFQVIGKEPLDIQAMEKMIKDLNNKELKRVLARFDVDHVERCAAVHTAAFSTSWVQVWVLVIAVLIGVISFISACAICCLYSRYKVELRRKAARVEADYMTIRTARTASVLGGSQLYMAKSDRSKAGSVLMLNQPATRMGSQLIINQPKQSVGSAVIMGSQMLVPHHEPPQHYAHDDMGSQIVYEYVRDGRDNMAYEDS